MQQKQKKRNVLPETFFNMAEELNLNDAWRLLNPKGKKITFYSNPHDSFSRIDMVWANKEIIKVIENIDILPNDWADHNPLRITWKGQKKKPRRWTLNTQILQEKEYLEKIEKELILFLGVNKKTSYIIAELMGYTKGIYERNYISIYIDDEQTKKATTGYTIEEIRVSRK